ncbi:MAG: TlpA disulfide reductase family protein [Planctomycetota bacterium]|nr:TlpA disulfide reductase family protein [Planctomycetota bacterium]
MNFARQMLALAVGFTLPLVGFAKAQSADPAWDAAIALKQKSAYAEAAVAFDAWTKANPTAPRFAEGLTESGVCWFSNGRAQVKLLRATPESTASFEKALGYFDQVLATKATPYLARARYMRGSTKFFTDDMPGAETEYSIVIDKWRADAKYLPRALEKRALVRRNRLDTAGAFSDLTRYATEFPMGEEAKSVKVYLEHLKLFGRPAPEVTAKAWVQGEPTTIAAHKGDVVILYFFASWCERCEQVRPFILDLHDRFESFGVKWIGIVDESQKQTVDSMRAFVGVNKIRFPVVMNSGQAALAYGAGGLPAMVLIDRAGNVRWNDNPNNLMDSTIEALLAEDPLQPATK